MNNCSVYIVKKSWKREREGKKDRKGKNVLTYGVQGKWNRTVARFWRKSERSASFAVTFFSGTGPLVQVEFVPRIFNIFGYMPLQTLILGISQLFKASVKPELAADIQALHCSSLLPLFLTWETLHCLPCLFYKYTSNVLDFSQFLNGKYRKFSRCFPVQLEYVL